jgi:glutathione S-transferase
MLILYSFRRCPYAIRARFALDLAKISYDVREIKLTCKPAEMLLCSPKGTVPVLVFADNVVIDESIEIVSWAFHQYNPKGWHYLPLDLKKVAIVDLMHKVFIPALNRYKYQNRYANVDMDLELKNIVRFLQLLNDSFVDNTFIITNKPSAVDILIFPFIRQLYVHEHTIFTKQANKNFVKWYDWFSDNVVFHGVMRKISVWQQD